MENSWRLSWTSVWLSNKTFTKDVYKLLNKNLNSVPTLKTFDKKTLSKEINDFYRCIKLKVHFKDTATHQHLTKDETFKKPSSKSCIPPKNPHMVKTTFIEATNDDINAEVKKIKRPKVLEAFWKGTKSTRRTKSDRWHLNDQGKQRRWSSYTGCEELCKRMWKVTK